MRQELVNLVIKLKKENEVRSIAINTGTLNVYVHSAKVHKYNATLEIIKQLETILTNFK